MRDFKGRYLFANEAWERLQHRTAAGMGRQDHRRGVAAPHGGHTSAMVLPSHSCRCPVPAALSQAAWAGRQRALGALRITAVPGMCRINDENRAASPAGPLRRWRRSVMSKNTPLIYSTRPVRATDDLAPVLDPDDLSVSVS